MALRKGMRVKELTKKVGQAGRHGTVLAIRGTSIEVRWDDGRVTTLAGGVLVPERRKPRV